MSPRLCLLLLLVVFSMAQGFRPIQFPAIPKEHDACVEQLTTFSKAFCTSECKEGFEDIIAHACRTQVNEHDIMTACCEQK